MYGFSSKSCDIIKKACCWMEEQGIAYQLHDYHADGLEEQQLRDFIDRLGWQPLLNTRVTTWCKLDETQRNTYDNAGCAIAVMLAQPAIIKQPLLDDGQGHTLFGFRPNSYQQFIFEVTV